MQNYPSSLRIFLSKGNFIPSWIMWSYVNENFNPNWIVWNHFFIFFPEIYNFKTWPFIKNKIYRLINITFKGPSHVVIMCCSFLGFGFYWLLSEVTPPTLLYFSIKYTQKCSYCENAFSSQRIAQYCKHKIKHCMETPSK